MTYEARQERYTHDYQASSASMTRRTASRQAAFLLPHLKPGMALLDWGCGPGSITAGLAEAVAPGQVVGLDIAQSRGVQVLTDAATDYFLNLDFADRAIEPGLINRPALEKAVMEFRKWGEHPDALFMYSSCEAIGRKE